MAFVSRTPRRALFLSLLLLVPGLQGCWGSKKQILLPPTPMSRTLTQTLEGVTVSVNVVNADAHRVVLDLTLDGPAQPYGYALELTWIYEPQINGPTLTAGGKELPFIPNAGDGVISGAQTAAGRPLFGHGLIAFDTSDLQWDQSRVPLRLSLPLLVNNEPFVGPLPVPTGTILATSTPTHVLLASHVITFDFTFDVAYDARQVVLEPRQEIKSNGVILTLESINVTASEARVSIHYSSTTPDTLVYQGDWVSYSELKVGPLVGPEGQETVYTLVGEPVACYGSAGGSQCVFSYVNRSLSLIDRTQVDCNLSVTVDQSASKPIQGYSLATSTGVFNFKLPVDSPKK